MFVQGHLLHSKDENVWMNGSKVGKFGRQQNLKSIAMHGPKVGESGKVVKEQNLKSLVMNGVKSKRGDMVKSVAMNGVKSRNFGKLEKCENDKETWSQSEGRLCKSIIRGLAKRNNEKHTMLADVEEEQEQEVICFDDITVKELPWHAVRKSRELELKYLRDLGVYENVDEKDAVEKY